MRRRFPVIRTASAIGLALVAIAVLQLAHPVKLAGQQANENNAHAAAADDGTLFLALVPVLRHPRCINCHSPGDFPRQGDDGHPHTMSVRRGPYGNGVTAEKCSACHQDHNLAGAHLPPGAPNWGLPSPDMPMIWKGLSDAQVCESIKDPTRNNNRTIDQLVVHLTQDKLVMWGWNPGEGRAAIPMPHDVFVAKVKAWQAAGAPCPSTGQP